MSARRLRTALSALPASALLLLSDSALADYTLNMRQGVTAVSRDVYSLHMIVLAIVTIIGIGVFGVMIYSMMHHRKSKGAVAAQFHENHKVEIVWTVLPFAVLVGLAIPATKTLLEIEDASESDITVKVTGYQWKWQYEYLDDGVSADGTNVKFFSSLATPRDQIENKAAKGEHYLLEVDNPIVVPVGKKVRFLMTAADVLHSWWVPDLGFKKDAIPGFINEAWARVDEPGVYRGQCAELCGKDHGFMPVVVVAKEEADYTAWVKEQKVAAAAAAAAASADKVWSKDDLMAKGAEVYNANCAACHQANGQGLGPFPTLVGSAITTGPAGAHIDIVINGKAAMPAFGAQLNDLELAAVITYERNAWGNAASVVQPADVKSAR